MIILGAIGLPTQPILRLLIYLRMDLQASIWPIYTTVKSGISRDCTKVAVKYIWIVK